MELKTIGHSCSQVIKLWLLKIQHGKPCHIFAKIDIPGQANESVLSQRRLRHRISSFKRPSVYLILGLLGEAFIRGWRLFQNQNRRNHVSIQTIRCFLNYVVWNYELKM